MGRNGLVLLDVARVMARALSKMFAIRNECRSPFFSSSSLKQLPIVVCPDTISETKNVV